MTLRIAGVVRESIVDGPGIRFVVFTQGCPHHCKGCHNPESHSPDGGYDCEVGTILGEIQKDPLLSGVTFSGGEPFTQPEELIELGSAVRALGLGLIIYTGYLAEDLLASENPQIKRLFELADYVIDGKFVMEQRNLELRFRGSDNQRIVDVQETLKSGAVVTAEL